MATNGVNAPTACIDFGGSAQRCMIADPKKASGRFQPCVIRRPGAFDVDFIPVLAVVPKDGSGTALHGLAAADSLSNNPSKYEVFRHLKYALALPSDGGNQEVGPPAHAASDMKKYHDAVAYESRHASALGMTSLQKLAAASYQHALEYYTKSLTRDNQTNRMRLIIAVPHYRDDSLGIHYARQVRHMFEESEFEIHLVDEPSAALNGVLTRVFSNYDPLVRINEPSSVDGLESAKPNERYTIVDCGSVTTDVATAEVKSLQPLQYELVGTKSAWIGSGKLDLVVREWLVRYQRVDEVSADWLRRVSDAKPDLDNMIQKWEPTTHVSRAQLRQLCDDLSKTNSDLDRARWDVICDALQDNMKPGTQHYLMLTGGGSGSLTFQKLIRAEVESNFPDCNMDYAVTSADATYSTSSLQDVLTGLTNLAQKPEMATPRIARNAVFLHSHRNVRNFIKVEDLPLEPQPLWREGDVLETACQKPYIITLQAEPQDNSVGLELNLTTYLKNGKTSATERDLWHPLDAYCTKLWIDKGEKKAACVYVYYRVILRDISFCVVYRRNGSRVNALRNKSYLDVLDTDGFSTSIKPELAKKLELEYEEFRVVNLPERTQVHQKRRYSQISPEANDAQLTSQSEHARFDAHSDDATSNSLLSRFNSIVEGIKARNRGKGKKRKFKT